MIIIKPEKLEGIVPRMLELTSRTTPWHRRDWRAGTLELVDEALNESRIPGTSSAALKELRGHMRKALGNDLGVSSIQKNLNSIVDNIGSASNANSHDVQLAEKHAQDLKQTYLQNWADVFESPSKAGNLDVEGTAKRIVSHLLYCGVPAPSIYSVIHDYKTADDHCEFSTLLRELDKRIKYKAKNFSFAVPVDRAPDFLHSSTPPSEWLSAKQLKQWKHKHAPQAKTERQHGGFILNVQARDVNEAASQAQQLLSQLSFKFESGSENRFSILPVMWSKEKGNSFPTRRGIQPLKLRAFQRADTLHHLEIGNKPRNILAIIEPLQTNNPHVALVNGWVAIESLLVDSGEDDRIGAERMARVVAASYFRTEMTWLAKNYADRYKGECSVAAQIKNAEASIERAKLMESVILERNDFYLLDPVDQLAIGKMQEAFNNPSEIFERTSGILQREFQRLYRKRNLIVHSGRVVGNGIESVADKVIPLLVNGIDQLLIASIQHDLDPKNLAASVAFKSLHLGQAGNSRNYSILDLLEVDEIIGPNLHKPVQLQ